MAKSNSKVSATKLIKDTVLTAAMIVGPGKFIKGAQMTAKAIALAKASVKGTENVRKAAAAARAAKSAEVVAAKETTRAKLKSNAIARKTEDRANASAAKSGRVRTEPKPKDPARQIRQNEYQRQDTRQANALSDRNPNTITTAAKASEGPKFLGRLPTQSNQPSTRRPLKGQIVGAGHLILKRKPKAEIHHAEIPSGQLRVPSTHAPRRPKRKAPDRGAAPSKTKRTQQIVLQPGQNIGKPSRSVSQVQAHKVTKSEVGKSPYGRKPDVSGFASKSTKVEKAEVTVKSTGRKPLTQEQLAAKAKGIAKTKTKRVFKRLRKSGK